MCKKFLKIVLSGLIFGISAWAFGTNIEGEFIARLNSLNTLSGNFEQTIKDQDGNDVQEPTSGRFVIKRPGYFYWHTQPPYEQLIVANQDNLWVYDPDLEQVTEYDQEKMDNSPASILSGDEKTILEQFDFTSEKKGDTTKYYLHPKKTVKKSFATLIFSYKKDTLQSLLLVDELEQKTHIVFSKVSVNQKVDMNQFRFVPPPNVDVIRQ